MSDEKINYDTWLSTTLNNLQQALKKHHVGPINGNLLQSITGEIVKSGENVEKIVIKFAQYGRFVDMGVGRNKTRRKQKPWFSKTKTREVARLRELLIGHMGNKIINEVESSLTDNLDINIINTK